MIPIVGYRDECAAVLGVSKPTVVAAPLARPDWWPAALPPPTPAVLTAFSLGLASGFVAGLLGVGGGVIVVPSLFFFTDLPYTTVLGTSFAAMLPTVRARLYVCVFVCE